MWQEHYNKRVKCHLLLDQVLGLEYHPLKCFFFFNQNHFNFNLEIKYCKKKIIKPDIKCISISLNICILSHRSYIYK